jgi:tetratricopeptide (TPR) repeat protein
LAKALSTSKQKGEKNMKLTYRNRLMVVIILAFVLTNFARASLDRAATGESSSPTGIPQELTEQEHLRRVMDPATDVEEFRQELLNYFAEMEEALQPFYEIVSIRNGLEQGGKLGAIGQISEAKKKALEMSPQDLSILKTAFSSIPNWRQLPQMLNRKLSPELRQRLEATAKGRTGGKIRRDAGELPHKTVGDDVGERIPNNCEAALQSGVSIADVAIAKGVVIGLDAAMEALPQDVASVAAHAAAAVARAVAEVAALVLETFLQMKEDCLEDQFRDGVNSSLSNLTNIVNDVSTKVTNISNTINDLGPKVDEIRNTVVQILPAIQNATAAIISNNNQNTATILNSLSSAKTEIINNTNAAKTEIINNDNANRKILEDLILRTQIEADLAEADSATPVALYLTPKANGGYLELVRDIVAQTINNIRNAGGSVGQAQSFFNQGEAQRAAGNFKAAYSYYRKAYKQAAN